MIVHHMTFYVTLLLSRLLDSLLSRIDGSFLPGRLSHVLTRFLVYELRERE